MSELVEIEVYSYEDPNVMLDVLNGSILPSYLEELQGSGGGDISVSILDEKIVADPDLLAYRNVLKVRLNGKVVGGFLIQKKNIDTVADSQNRELARVSGENLRTWCNDASVQPAGGLRKTSYEQRAFNFASERGTWYNPSQWVAPTNVVKWGDVVDSPWRYAPSDWPDAPLAYWIWSQNSISSAPAGDNFFRYEFTAATDAKYSFFVAADDSYAVYVDGQLTSQSDEDTVAYASVHRVDVDLLAGPHIFAVRVNNKVAGPAALLAAVFTYGDPLVPSSATLVSYTGKAGDTNWKVAGYPDPIPGWSPGEIVLTLMEEAEARGVRFPLWLTPTFTATTDSYGQTWSRDLDWSFGLGKSLLDVIEQLEELVCDVWIDPDTFELHMAARRGVDRSITLYDLDGVTPISTPLVFARGHNLAAASIDGMAEIKNSLIVQTSDGWIAVEDEDSPSLDKYGRVEALLETGLSETISKAVAGVVFEQKANPEEGASYTVVPVEGYIPFVDYAVGDWVLAPDDRGLSVKRRVMSISVEVDAAGNPEYTVEFDTIFRDNEDRIDRWLKKLGGGSLGGQFATAGGQSIPIGQPVIPPTGQPIVKFPLAPDNLAASSVGLWQANGEAFSEVTLTWDPVTSNTDGTETVPAFYEVWGHLTENSDTTYQRFAVVTTNTASIRPFQTGSEWTFRVRALNASNAVGSYSDTVDHTMEAPSVPMAAPAAPSLTSNKGVLIVTWDGLLGGVAPPPQFRYVYAKVATSSGGTYTRAGSTLQRDGRNINITGLTVGTEYWVKLVAVDGIGLSSADSPSANTILTGIDLGDLDTSIQDAIDAAEQAGIDAHSSSNLLIDASFESPNVANYWDIVSPVTVNSTSARTGTKDLRFPSTGSPYEGLLYKVPIPCDEGEEYLVGAWARAQGAGSTEDGALEIGVYYGTDAGSLTTYVALADSPDGLGSTYETLSGVFEVPVDAKFFVPAISMVADDTGTNSYLIDDLSVYKRTPGELIFDGGITAVKIAAGAVVAEKIAADAIAAGNIQAGAVTAGKIAAGSVTANEIAAESITGNEIAAGTIETVHLGAGVGGELDISANSSVQIIVGQIDTVQGELDSTSENLEEMQTYYKFGPDGAEISTPSSPFSLKLDNDQISMLELGVVVSYWNAGTMYVRSFVGEEVILGNHKIEKYGTDTVVRKL